MNQHNAERDALTKAEGENLEGRTIETLENEDTGELTSMASGPEDAGPTISRPEENLSPTTEKAKCACPRCAGILREEAAARGEPPPRLRTTNGGRIIKNGQAVPIEACDNCRAIKNDPSNGIRTVGPNPDARAPNVPVIAPPVPGGESDERGGMDGAEGASGLGDE
jgi:hypothetical protein